MERSSDDMIEYRGARRGDIRQQSVAVIDANPGAVGGASTSGAHWANRDKDPEVGRTPPYRRPPAENSFPADVPSPTQVGLATNPATPSGWSGLKARLAAGADLDRNDTIGLLVGPGHEIRPHRAAARSIGDKDSSAGTASAGSRRPRTLLRVALTTVVVVLIGGAAAGAVLFGRSSGLASGVRGGTDSDARHSVVAPLAGRTEASFELVTGTTKVILRSENLGDDLYRISTSADSGTVPRPVVDEDQVQLHLTPSGSAADAATGAVEIVLASRVKWALRFTGGADEQRVDLSQGKVSGIEVVGGARRIEMNLPVSAGTVPVRITGAVDEFVLTAPKDNPVRVRLDSGAKTVAAGEKTQRDVPPGSTFTPRNWKVADRYDVDAAARITLFSVEPKA